MSNPRKIDDDNIISMVGLFAGYGLRDSLGGGVSTRLLARSTPWDQESVAETCRRLVDEGRLVRVLGHSSGYDGTRPRSRASYLPADHPDAPDESAEVPA